MSRRPPVTDADLLEALFRADKLLKGYEEATHGDLRIMSNDDGLYIFVRSKTALYFSKSKSGVASMIDVRKRCEWSPSTLDVALIKMREIMILDDLAEL